MVVPAASIGWPRPPPTAWWRAPRNRRWRSHEAKPSETGGGSRDRRYRERRRGLAWTMTGPILGFPANGTLDSRSAADGGGETG